MYLLYMLRSCNKKLAFNYLKIAYFKYNKPTGKSQQKQ